MIILGIIINLLALDILVAIACAKLFVLLTRDAGSGVDCRDEGERR